MAESRSGLGGSGNEPSLAVDSEVTTCRNTRHVLSTSLINFIFILFIRLSRSHPWSPIRHLPRKIRVHKPVKINAHSSGRPAISGGCDYSNLTIILPMYPNGTPGPWC